MAHIKEKILESNIQEHMKEAKYYDRIHTELYNKYEQERIKSSLYKVLMNFNNNATILEIGPGTGNLTIKLLQKGYKKITCVDISKEMMEELKKKVRDIDHNIEFIVSDIDSFLENNTSKFDIVLLSSVLHHFPDYASTLKNIEKILNNTGCIYITHEPLKPSKNSILVKILLKIDFFAYTARYIFLISIGRLKYLGRNCEYSDYHTGERAIDATQLEAIFGDNYVINMNKYSVAKFGITAFLLEKINYANSFEFLAVKK
ncbi:tRNA 5-carboxymethoxyuridine methyltransferase [Methanosarcinales archaeon]|nr:tRNA 5-carboxymethoxyuridine methyltransferase [Methanosarcinales archaeon]